MPEAETDPIAHIRTQAVEAGKGLGIDLSGREKLFDEFVNATDHFMLVTSPSMTGIGGMVEQQINRPADVLPLQTMLAELRKRGLSESQVAALEHIMTFYAEAAAWDKAVAESEYPNIHRHSDYTGPIVNTFGYYIPAFERIDNRREAATNAQNVVHLGALGPLSPLQAREYLGDPGEYTVIDLEDYGDTFEAHGINFMQQDLTGTPNLQADEHNWGKTDSIVMEHLLHGLKTTGAAGAQEAVKTLASYVASIIRASDQPEVSLYLIDSSENLTAFVALLNVITGEDTEIEMADPEGEMDNCLVAKHAAALLDDTNKARTKNGKGAVIIRFTKK